MPRDDRIGDLEDAARNANDLADALVNGSLQNSTRHDVKEALDAIRSFNFAMRVIRRLDEISTASARDLSPVRAART